MGIEYSIETGVSTSKLGVWNEHVFTGFKTKRNWKGLLFRNLIRFADRITFSDNLNKICRYALFRIFRIRYGIPHLIPTNLLDYFPVIENHFIGQNLFVLMEKTGVRIVKKEPKFNRSEASLIRNIPDLLKEHDLVLLKLNSLDRLGHLYGPLSEQTKKRIQYLDAQLKSLFGKLEKNVALIVMSDHGMVPTQSTHDIIGFLKDRGYILGLDYFAFVGATYTSFWFRDPETKESIERDLNELEFGKVLTSEEKAKLGLNKLSYGYGETFFVNNEHAISFPEFYHIRKPPAGMHGYAFSNYDNPLFLLYDGSSNHAKTTTIDFVDIMPTILKLYDIAVPQDLDGKAVI